MDLEGSAPGVDRGCLSLRVATVATIVALPFGIAIALALARGRFWGQSLLNGVVHLPLVMPPVVTGYLLLMVFGQRGAIGSLLPLRHRHRLQWEGAALAGAVMGFPLMVRAIRLSLETIDRKLEAAASTLGASRDGARHRHAAPRPPRHLRRAGAVVRSRPRRVRRDHHLRRQHPRRDADACRRRSTPTRRCPAATSPRCA